MPQFFFPADEVQKRVLFEFAYARLPRASAIGRFGQPVGIIDADARLLAVAIWHDINAFGHIELTAAAVPGSRWCTRGIMRGLLSMPFRQMGARRLIVHIEAGNQPAVKFARQAGMKREAVLRHHFAHRAHAEVWTMMAAEYERSRWVAVLEEVA